MKTIFELQNEESNIKMLAAQRQLYLKAKRIQWASFIIQVPLAIAITIAMAFSPSIQDIATVSNIIIIIFSTIIPMLEDHYKTRAAVIQEYFDHKVLQLKWNHFKLKYQPEWVEINKEAEEHFKKAGNRDKLVNWYFSGPDCIKMPYAALICQRSNLVWDSHLRRRFYRSVFFAAILVFMVILSIGWQLVLSIPDLVIKGIFPLMPLFIWCQNQIKGNREAVKRLDNLKGNLDNVFQKTFTDNYNVSDLTVDMRQIQDEIYDNRSKAPLIPELLYNQFRSRDDSGMYMGVEELCKEANSLFHNR